MRRMRCFDGSTWDGEYAGGTRSAGYLGKRLYVPLGPARRALAALPRFHRMQYTPLRAYRTICHQVDGDWWVARLVLIRRERRRRFIYLLSLSRRYIPFSPPPSPSPPTSPLLRPSTRHVATRRRPPATTPPHHRPSTASAPPQNNLHARPSLARPRMEDRRRRSPPLLARLEHAPRRRRR